MDSYPAIEDHGLIGDLQTAALVTCDGTVDWFCAPRFDSPSVFAGLLDKEKGGYFQIAPHDTRYVTKQLYLPGTPILITRFISADGVAEVMDFMPVTGERATDAHRLVRIVNMVRGACASGWSAGRGSTTPAKSTSWNATPMAISSAAGR